MENVKNDPNIKVLMYHRVMKDTSTADADLHCVAAEDFRNQLQILDRLNYTPITFEDYHLYQQDKLTLPKKPIILTFDDGHLDTCETAVPILGEFNMRAVVFVMGNRRMREARWDPNHARYPYPLMTDQQIRDIRAEGFEIGAHSMSHRELTLLDEPELYQEIQGSKRSVENVLGEKIISFAYPYGRLNSTIQAIVKQSGYEFGCGVYSGPPRFGNNPYDIRRLAINSGTGTARYLLKMITPFQYVEWMYGKIKSHNSDTGERVPAGRKSAVSELDLCHSNQS